MKILNLLLAAGMAMSLNAAKLAGPDENGRLYNTAYFDIKADTQSPVFDVIGYSKRAGTFNWSKLYKQLENFNADTVEYNIKTRIEIPNDIKTSSVYVTIGDNFSYILTSGGNWSENEELEVTTETKSSSSRSRIYLNTKVNGKTIASGSSILATVKKDDFANNYVDLEISFNIDLCDDKDYIPTHKKHMSTVVAKNIGAKFDSIKIKVAPKSRTFQSKWVEPKIYVMDE
jgi:hypothetical protein